MRCLYCDLPLVAPPRTKPRKYCGDKCKAAWHRLRERVLAEAGVGSLVSAVRLVFNLAMPGPGADSFEREEAQLAALAALASHRLVRHPWPLTLTQEVQVSPNRLDLIPPSRDTQGGPAPSPAALGAETMSAEMSAHG